MNEVAQTSYHQSHTHTTLSRSARKQTTNERATTAETQTVPTNTTTTTAAGKHTQKPTRNKIYTNTHTRGWAGGKTHPRCKHAPFIRPRYVGQLVCGI